MNMAPAVKMAEKMIQGMFTPDVVLHHDRQEPAGDDQHRRDRDDVAGAAHQRGGHRAGAAERLAHEGDEAAGRRVRPGELRQRVAEQCDGDDGDEHDQRRGEAGRDHDPGEAEVEAVGRADVRHRRGGDVDQAERPAVQPLRGFRCLRFRERNVCRFAHVLTPSRGWLGWCRHAFSTDHARDRGGRSTREFLMPGSPSTARGLPPLASAFQFLRNVPDESPDAQGPAREWSAGGRARQGAFPQDDLAGHRDDPGLLVGGHVGAGHDAHVGAAAGASARTRLAAISPIRLSGSRTVVSGG